MGILRTILIILLVYWITRFIFRWLVPILLARFVQRKAREFQEKANQQSSQRDQTFRAPNNPDISITPPNSGKRKDFDPGGDYVDYEEVKD